ncbi:hypothetical protein AMATHDRAFT_60448 [Amanita thiersii Skay4041]|uniref:Rrp15p-domain-containing protein n=1 Tax=Amanita thiersii Skay4041 TaxID=703135 RepID=A0A2A9NSP8_9AGAR|nr:hypothetical protein AMATHDRAFT_60448 [Amanita thiersii Skay4041]
MSPPLKRQKLEESYLQDEDGDEEQDSDISDGVNDDPLSFSASDSDEESTDTADEIENLKREKSKKTSKRKLRATGAVAFGTTLQSLLNTGTPSALPLSLKPSIARKHNDQKQEHKAKRVLRVERKEKEDKGRVRDVIGGWGGEGERALRKVAQRGVVKLFNTIQQVQASAADAAEEKKAMRGSGKPTLPAPDIESKSKAKKKGKNKDNILGRGHEGTVNKDQFFDFIKSGGIVSKT